MQGRQNRQGMQGRLIAKLNGMFKVSSVKNFSDCTILLPKLLKLFILVQHMAVVLHHYCST